MIGLRIVSVERPITEWGAEDNRTVLVRLEDGTALEFVAHGYEVDDVELTHLTPETLRRRALVAQGEREQRRHEERVEAAYRAKKAAHITEMRQQLSPKAFEKWRRETYPELSEALKDVWTSPPIAEQLAAASLLFAPLGDQQAIVPLTKRKARRS